jgi:hypothetical protein
MSSTPSSATPDAGPAAAAEAGETMTLARRASEQAARLAGLARDNPKTALAAVAAGVAAAAAIPLVRAARRKPGNGAAAPKADAAAGAPARKRATARKSPARSAKKS